MKGKKPKNQNFAKVKGKVKFIDIRHDENKSLGSHSWENDQILFRIKLALIRHLSNKVAC